MSEEQVLDVRPSHDEIRERFTIDQPDFVHSAEADLERGMMHEEEDRPVAGCCQLILQPTAAKLAERAVRLARFQRVNADEQPRLSFQRELDESVGIERGVAEIQTLKLLRSS